MKKIRVTKKSINQIQDVGNAIENEYEGLNLGLGYQF